MITLTDTTTDEQYAELFTKSVGEVFKIDGDYEYIVGTLESKIPSTRTFRYTAITPGTRLFAMHGHSHCVIVENTLNS